jgi:hypothetical protein
MVDARQNCRMLCFMEGANVIVHIACDIEAANFRVPDLRQGVGDQKDGRW